jgi:hypothetical protein
MIKWTRNGRSFKPKLFTIIILENNTRININFIYLKEVIAHKVPSMYLFFSSDIYSLYKKDILSAISLPRNYCLHFRYLEDDVPDLIIKNLELLEEKEGIVVYVSGNNPEIDVKDRQISFLPIRTVRVKKAYLDKTTRLVHIFLELNNFIDCKKIPEQASQNSDLSLPPHKFINDINSYSSSIVEWHTKVKQLVIFDNYFENHLFFSANIKNAEENYRDQVEIVFDNMENSSYLSLREDKEYLLEIAILNSTKTVNSFELYSIKLLYESKDFFVTNPERIKVGADLDNRTFKLITKDITTIKSSAFLKIQSLKEESVAYEELLRLNIKRSISKALIYLIFTLIGIVGTFLLALSSGHLATTGLNPSIIGWLALSLILILTAALGFYYFNKRN